MKFGVREICDVVLKAKATQNVGNKTFYRGEPVCYFDTLKTSSMEGAATTVYAQGGHGNARLMAWDGERTVTFTMEDALISPEGFMILSGAGLVDASKDATIKQHMTEVVPVVTELKNDVPGALQTGEKLEVQISNIPYTSKTVSTDLENYMYVMLMKDGEIVSEPFIPNPTGAAAGKAYKLTISTEPGYKIASTSGNYALNKQDCKDKSAFPAFDSVLVDYYVERPSGAQQINITPDKFGGNYYLEASTLFRDTNGVDYPAEFIIPNCKIQSNFTFTMASSGDPSTFTFTMDAFPDYTKFDKTEKVLASIQIIDTVETSGMKNFRDATYHEALNCPEEASVTETKLGK